MAYIRSMHTRSTLANIHSIHFICNSFNSWYSLSETVLTSENSSTWLHTVLGQAGSVSFVAFVAFCPELSSGSCFLPFQLFCSASPGRFLVKTRCRTPITLTLYSGWNKGGLIPGALSSHGKSKMSCKKTFWSRSNKVYKGWTVLKASLWSDSPILRMLCILKIRPLEKTQFPATLETIKNVQTKAGFLCSTIIQQLKIDTLTIKCASFQHILTISKTIIISPFP